MLYTETMVERSSLPVSTGKRVHLGFLDGTRALAALYVVLHHGWYTIWPAAMASSPLWTHFLGFGHVAVNVFIVLSGFSLMLPVVRGNGSLPGGTFAFFRRRAQRILPPYYFAMGFSLLLIWTLIGKPSGTHWDISLPVTAYTIAIHLLLLQDFFEQHIHKINHAFWSISLEWWIYFLFPPLVVAWKRFGAVATTLLTVALSLAICHILRRLGHDYTLQYVGLFTLGMMGSEIVHSRSEAMQKARAGLPWEIITGAAAMAALVVGNFDLPHLSEPAPKDTMIGLFAMLLLVMLALRPENRVTRFLSQKPLLFVGSFAYSIYLIHAPLLQVLWQYALRPLHLSPSLTFGLLTVAGTPLIVGVSYFFFRFCERPFMTRPGQPAPKTEREVEAAAVESPAP